jgi:hypothetical protein
MRYQLHIAYRNRLDLLRDAMGSLRDIGNFHIWPNNGAPSLPNPEVDIDIPVGTKITPLPDISPISVINMMMHSSVQQGDDVMFWAHNDCFAEPGAAAEFKAATEQLHASGTKWGVYFSLYDILCAINVKAIKEVGYFDPMFFQYTADVEYYYRMKRSGYAVETWLPGRDGRIKHRGSMTVRSDGVFNYATQWRERTRFDKNYYALKWGAAPGGELFAEPFQDYRPVKRSDGLAW